MELSESDAIDIVQRGVTLFDRRSPLIQADEGKTDREESEIWLQKWRDAVARGDLEEFKRRLAWESLDLEDARRMVGAVRLTECASLPDWINNLKTVLMEFDEASVRSAEGSTSTRSSYIQSSDPVPFEEILAPVVEAGRKILTARTSQTFNLLSETARAQLDRQLLRRLSYICGQTLLFEFQLYKAAHAPSLLLRISPSLERRELTYYDSFVAEMLSGGSLNFFREYAVLSRLVSVTIEGWASASEELLRRLEADWSEIKRFSPAPDSTQEDESPTDQITDIKPELSDPHNGGRAVVALAFRSGRKLIYKPRNLSLDIAFCRLLEWVNERIRSDPSSERMLPLRAPRMLDRPTHGWMEYIEPLPCHDKREIQNYYQRSGMLLGLIYFLDGTDLHHENLIAHGEDPVIIDLETLMHPIVRSSDESLLRDRESLESVDAPFIANDPFWRSVVRTGFLPRWQVGLENQGVYDLSGLGGFGEVEMGRCLPTWQSINTDQMTLIYKSRHLIGFNQPVFEGATSSVGEYVEDFVAGFQRIYRFLMDHRDALLDSSGPLAVFKDQPMRFIFRASRLYGSLLHKSLEPQFLREGRDRSIELDRLCQAILACDAKDRIDRLIPMEHRALERLDIPLFVARAKGSDLIVSSHGDENSKAPVLFSRSFEPAGRQQIIRNLRRLNEKDMLRQSGLIRASVYAHSVYAMATPSVSRDPRSVSESATILTPDQAVSHATAIANELSLQAVRSRDGGVSWVGMLYLPEAERIQLQPLGHSLYDGLCGVALFLGAVAKITDDASFRELALAAMKAPIASLSATESSRRLVKYPGIGAGKGSASLAYGCLSLSRLLEEPELQRAGLGFAREITPERIDQDEVFDVMSGSAGAILGLLAAHQISGDPAMLSSARSCGQRLLACRVRSAAGPRAWKTIRGRILTGFSHGAAGISCALSRLFKATGESCFLDAALEAIEFERAVFNPEIGNWPDFRYSSPSESHRYACSWCHGAPGIGLGRLGALEIHDTENLRAEISVALETTRRLGLTDVDHLCCGNFGRIDVMLVASQKLRQPDYLSEAWRLASQATERAARQGSFGFGGNHPAYSPGFFQGLAGIGYGLLRLSHPDLLPSVSLFE